MLRIALFGLDSVGWARLCGLALTAIAAAHLGCGAAEPAPAPSPTSASLGEPAPKGPADPAENIPGLAQKPPLAAPLDEKDAGAVLGEAAPKLAQIATLSPKTHEGLLKKGLVKKLRECEGQKLVPVAPAPGLIVASGAKPMVSELAQKRLAQAGALASQRGMLIEVVSGHATVEDAVRERNHALIEAGLAIVQAAPKAERKDKNYAKKAREAIGDMGPEGWQAEACDRGRLGGHGVSVRLVAQNASGGRGNVLVAASEGKERFDKDNYGGIYWDKPKGKPYRMLTEIMSAGMFVRSCDLPYEFTTSESQPSTWRCKVGSSSDSWDPENRPIPAWQ